MTASGITTSNDDVKLTVLAGVLMIDDGVTYAQVITLDSSHLTLNVVGNITQISGNVILASGLQLLGSGTVTLNDGGNNVASLAATYNGPIAYTDASGLTMGTLTDGRYGMTASGITTINDDVKLTVLAFGTVIGAASDHGADDITLAFPTRRSSDLGNITQISGNVILASGLQLLGSGTVTLNDTGNNVSTLAATYNGPIAYTDASGLVVGTVTDGPSGMTASGITTSGSEDELTPLAVGLRIGAVAGAGA